MTLTDISNSRILSQRIASTEFKRADEVVSAMGAMQAQDYPMAKWAIGVRMSHPTDEKIEASFNRGEILRTHLMRPTLHFITADDIYWMLELTSPQIKKSLGSRQKQLELTGSILSECFLVFEKSLSGGLSLTRDELAIEFNKAGIKTYENRLYFILALAELEGLLCSGPVKSKKQSFALLPLRVPKKKVLSREESLGELARRYFNSHGPATLQDFVWWSGLGQKDARTALESVKDNFITETIESGKYFFSDSIQGDNINASIVHLLPAYDEFLISYRDRSVSLGLADNKKTVSNNGIFYPVIVVNGQVAGTWKRSLRKDILTIEAGLFHKPDKKLKESIETKAVSFGRFLNAAVKVIFLPKLF